jgi:hypothetical protein
MSKLILCPWHEESTPSLAIYHDGYKCYGCGKYGPLSDLGMEGADIPPPKPAENLVEKFDYIRSLPGVEVRGFSFPADDEAFYICWPDESYYKARLFNPRKGKYLNPSGHKQPMLFVRHEGNRELVVVEGELNALSVAKACPEVDVWCPGSASNFKSTKWSRYLNFLLQYSRILVVADRDAAGAEACIEIMSQLQGKVQEIKAHLMSPDANDVLTGCGSGILRTQINQAIGRALEAGPEEG